MKVLKNEIRESIVRSAKKEFLKKGYRNSSMRSIAGRTSITVGNIYKYFRDKDDLFNYIVDPVYREVVNLIKHHDDDLGSENHSLDKLIAEQLGVLSKLVKEKKDELIILLYGSEGSRYEGLVEKFILLLSEGTSDHLSDYYQDREIEGKNLDNLAYALAKSFLEGLFAILKKTNDSREMEKLSMEYIKISLNGFKNIL